MKVDVRVVSATNKNLQEEVSAGRFREDLLYRLNIVTIRIPPLKDRKEDIPLLVEHFLSRKSKTKPKTMSPAAMEVLMNYDWPGNVRELEHVVEGATVLSQGEMIQPKDLWVNSALTVGNPPSEGKEDPGVPEQAPAESPGELPSLEELEKIHIQKVLEHHGFNRVKSAQVLGITPKTLYLKIKKYGIRTQP